MSSKTFEHRGNEQLVREPYDPAEAASKDTSAISLTAKSTAALTSDCLSPQAQRQRVLRDAFNLAAKLLETRRTIPG